MELIKGLPITHYCDQARLTIAERMELMVSVCRAIQHAHHKGIIHRDIKPSNVLVSDCDGAPAPKVIDFGVAKAVDQRLTERTLFTHHGMIVGTLEYMSPEQAENTAQDADTRSDVYSLGVLLYELLTGTTALGRLRSKQAGFSEILRRIREEEPASPSSRLASGPDSALIAERCRTVPAKLARMVRGELDWIALKSLEKDRARRYETANDLALDLRRYLDGETIEAGPPSTTYRLRKFARRHRVAVAIAGAFAAVLVTSAAISAGQAARASREESKARASEVEVKAMLNFFRDKVLAAARPENQDGGLGRDATIRMALDAAEPRIASEFASMPAAEADLRDTLGTTYLYLGEATRAASQHVRAMAIREATMGPDHPQTLASVNNLAVSYRDAGRFDEAIVLHLRDLKASSAKLGPEHPDTIRSMSNLASSYKLAGSIDRAIDILKEVLRLRELKQGRDHPETITSVNQLAAAYQAAGRHAEAIPLHQRDLDFSIASLGRHHPDTLTAMSNLAAAYQAIGRVSDALPLLEEVIASRREKLGRDHPHTLTSMNLRAAAIQAVGRPAEALPMFEEILSLRKARLGPDHPDTLKSMSNLAQTYRAVGRPAEALPMFEEILSLRKVRLGPDHPDTLRSMALLAESYVEAKRWAEAEALLRDCLKRFEAKLSDDWLRFLAMSQLGTAMAGRSLYAEAERNLIEGYEGMMTRRSKMPPNRQGELATYSEQIARFYDAWGKPESAVSWRSNRAHPADVGPKR